MSNSQSKNQATKSYITIPIGGQLRQISKRSIVVVFAIAILVIMAIVLVPIVKQWFVSPEDRILKIYEEMTDGVSSGSSISKVGTAGIHLYDGSEVLKSNSNDAIYIKHYNEKLPLFMLNLIDLTDVAKPYDKLSTEQKQYGSSYSNAVEASETPSEFSSFEIDEDFNGAIGIPIGANNYVHYALYSKDLSDIEATYNVCSAFYSEYGNWGKDKDGFPTPDMTTLDSGQLRLSDKGNSLVMTIEPRSLSYPDRNNIGRCVRGMLEMPERIREEFEDDWLDYANGSSSAKKSNSTHTYTWNGFEMKVRHSSEYQYDTSSRGKTEYTSEITIYKK